MSRQRYLPMAVGMMLSLVAGSPGFAGETIDLRILALAPGDSVKDVLPVSENDVLVSGSRFRVEVRAKTDGDVTVVLESSQGEEVQLIADFEMAAGVQLVLPRAGDWFRLDDHTGTERINVRFTGKGGNEVVGQTIRHVSPEFMSLGGFLPFAGQISVVDAPASSTNTNEFEMAENVSRAQFSSPGEYQRILEDVRPDALFLTRGLSEIALYKTLSPGVVLIVSSDRGIGSGFIISDEGDIITNWHVVGDAEMVGVIFKGAGGDRPSQIHQAIVEKVDQTADLALLRVLAPPANLTTLKLGTMEGLEVGADVHAIGHPTGEAWSYTKGIVSQIRPGYRWRSENGVAHSAMVIQTQTPINPGNSGGPLINDEREVVGVNTFKKEGSGLNFAVSVYNVREFLATKEAVAREGGAPNGTLQKDTASKCEPKRTRKDTDGDGKVDRIEIDTTCDGRIDMVIIDEDQDGIPDFALVDRDGDQRPDLKIIDTEGDGKFDVWLYDNDGDGKPDLVGYDDDQDGTVDRFKRI